MASRARLDWRGAELVARMRTASRLAVNEAVDAAADDARASHEWVNRTGQLEEEIVTEHASPRARNPVARFGTTRRRGFYGLFHEEGTVSEYARPFLRPAADRHFPSLAERIRRRLR
jgi:hypothetical protein